MKKASIVAAVCVIALTAGEPGHTQSAWVNPGYYEFGTCGGLGGDTVPGIINQRQYSRSTCYQNYNPSMCVAQANFYLRQYAENGGNPSCESFMRRQAASCEQDIRARRSDCDNLDS